LVCGFIIKLRNKAYLSGGAEDTIQMEHGLRILRFWVSIWIFFAGFLSFYVIILISSLIIRIVLLIVF